MTNEQVERLIAAVERLSDASERSTEVNEAILTLWYSREKRDLDAIAQRDANDAASADDMRRALARYDLLRAAEAKQ